MSASALLAARSSWHLISGRNLVRFAIDCALRALFRHSCRFLRGKMAKLNHLRPLVSRQVPTGVTKRQTKKADPIYGLPEHRAWRAAVLRRAGFRCEAIEDARRCPRMAPQYRLEADHIIEIADGGSRYDLTNGQCLCRHHHSSRRIKHRQSGRWEWGFPLRRPWPSNLRHFHAQVFFLDGEFWVACFWKVHFIFPESAHRARCRVSSERKAARLLALFVRWCLFGG